MKKNFLVILFFVFLAGCATPKTSLQHAITGSWVDKDGYELQFFPDGKGFIPGVSGKIPDSEFTYTVTDEQHIEIIFQGSKNNIGISIVNDTLTWRDSLGEIVYTRKPE